MFGLAFFLATILWPVFFLKPELITLPTDWILSLPPIAFGLVAALGGICLAITFILNLEAAEQERRERRQRESDSE